MFYMRIYFVVEQKNENSIILELWIHGSDSSNSLIGLNQFYLIYS